MNIKIQITSQPIELSPDWENEDAGTAGAVAEFRGKVRDRENGEPISALEYEAFCPMAENEMRRILTELAGQHPFLAARVIHRIGIIPVGETAIYVMILSRHRDAAFATLAEFMNRLKVDVPIWKRRALPVQSMQAPTAEKTKAVRRICSLEEAVAEINARVTPIAAVASNLEQAAGRVLREPCYATEDLPARDRSTRDGYAVRGDDPSLSFQVVDTLHAADWKPRELKIGEAVRVATGTALPGDNLQVIMQEEVERTGQTIRISKRTETLNLRKRGEEMRAGQSVVPVGTRLNAGALAMLATAGCLQPMVSPQLKIIHFTTGDELVSPEQKPGPGQIRDSNSILIRSLSQPHARYLHQQRLPEDFAQAKAAVQNLRALIQHAEVVLVSGGASVGDKDFTRELLEFLGFEIIFHRINLRPGAPLIFGVAGHRIAFGIPGNPLSHFVVWHTFIAVALARLTGADAPTFHQATLALPLTDAACPRETLWPARCQLVNGKLELTPLPWHSAGDITGLAAVNALIRVPANTQEMPAGATTTFLKIF